MKHITQTGWFAGVPFCGAERNTRDKYTHPGLWIYNPELADSICPQCLAEYNDGLTPEEIAEDAKRAKRIADTEKGEG